MASSSSASVGKKETSTNNQTGPHKQAIFRRERSFILQRSSSQIGMENHQRERSFVREGTSNVRGGIVKNDINLKSRGEQFTANIVGLNVEQSGKVKPNMEIYRPPSVRVTSGDGYSSRTQFQQQLTGVEKHHQPRMLKSRTSLDMVVSSNVSKGFPKRPTSTTTLPESRASSTTNMFDLQRSKSSGSRLVDSQRTDDVANLLDLSGSTSKLIKESVYMNVSAELIPSLDIFPDSRSRLLLAKLTIDPDGASSRMVMDGVKVLFDQAVKCSRFAAPIARFCFYIIERETKETFLESLLNQCQESFQERDRFWNSTASVPGCSSSQRWVAFIFFLNEMYSQLKCRSAIAASQAPCKMNFVDDKTPADLILLTLLAESCCATLKEISLHSPKVYECLFSILSGIGWKIENELPKKMQSIWNAIRDAFVDMDSFPALQCILLQLLELRAAKWQLPATAVTYYYSSISDYAF